MIEPNKCNQKSQCPSNISLARPIVLAEKRRNRLTERKIVRIMMGWRKSLRIKELV